MLGISSEYSFKWELLEGTTERISSLLPQRRLTPHFISFLCLFFLVAHAKALETSRLNIVSCLVMSELDLHRLC